MSISVIIPTLNDAAYIANKLGSVRAEKPLEIFVVDGGRSDATWPTERRYAGFSVREAVERSSAAA